ncbi:type II toxin-antitoxin system VapB family antitoxin [Microlunatus ginsengisoli]|uniref:Type II toxin-antitoxin system VapB family antitoxin n=1 Tax=Microlunatus ginsengisoli TaxID=363863 RepID=A0ABP7AMV5_9ACTN
MSRTNIDIDEELVREVMRRFDVATKREAVDLALRRLVGTSATADFLLSLEGTGWQGDLAELRSDSVPAT